MGKSKCRMKLTGQDEIIKDIERIGGNMPKIIGEALENAGEITTEEYVKVVEKHRYSGVTEDSIVKGQKAQYDGEKVTLQTGFDMEKGGVASIFLDRGTPKQKPIKYIARIKRSRKIKESFRNSLESAWEKLIK